MKLLITLITLRGIVDCIQSNYMSSAKVSKGISVGIIMPKQKCDKKDNDRILTVGIF
jgi:hypothetical protein